MAYSEPITTAANVESEGFVCVSISALEWNVEVDEYVNNEKVNLEFNNDFEE